MTTEITGSTLDYFIWAMAQDFQETEVMETELCTRCDGTGFDMTVYESDDRACSHILCGVGFVWWISRALNQFTFDEHLELMRLLYMRLSLSQINHVIAEERISNDRTWSGAFTSLIGWQIADLVFAWVPELGEMNSSRRLMEEETLERIQ